jgi:hypothetical protein
MAKGFVYILSNAGMPGLLKIGFSTKVPTERAAELNTTGVPSPFDVEYYCLIEEPARLEAAVHKALSANRHTGDREFFRLSLATAIQTVEQRAPFREHTWCKSPSKRPRPSSVSCHECGASYVTAQYCPKCRVKLAW